MRMPTLPFLFSHLALTAVACGGGEFAEEAVVLQFRERSTPLDCERAVLEQDIAVTSLRATTDSTWAVLDEPQRQVIAFDDSLRPLWTLELEKEGPRALPRPVGFSVAGDTLVHVVDRGRLALVSMDIRSGESRAVPLGFLPSDVLALSDGSVAVTALPLGPEPRELLFRVREAEIQPLDVPQRRYPDLTINGLGNMTTLEADADDRILLAHQFLEPRAFRIEADGAVREITLPVPDGTAAKRSYVPEPPVTEDDIPFVYVGASAVAGDRAAGRFFLLTQTGHRIADRSERAIMVLDSDLQLAESYLTDVNAGHLLFLRRRSMLILVDDEDRFFVCTVPPAPTDAAVT